MRLLRLLWSLVYPPEQELMQSVVEGKVNRVSSSLSRNPKLDRPWFFAWDSHHWRLYPATKREIKAYRSGQRKTKRNTSNVEVLPYQPTDFSEALWRDGKPDLAEEMLQILVAYGFPPPHRCAFTSPLQGAECKFSCACGKSETVHELERICCEVGPQQCRRCKARWKWEGVVMFVIKSHPADLRITRCRTCHALIEHSAVPHLSPVRVRTLRYVSDGDCRMCDPTTGEVFPDVHQEFREDSEYDTDYNRTTYSLSCVRCRQNVGYRVP